MKVNVFPILLLFMVSCGSSNRPQVGINPYGSGDSGRPDYGVKSSGDPDGSNTGGGGSHLTSTNVKVLQGTLEQGRADNVVFQGSDNSFFWLKTATGLKVDPGKVSSEGSLLTIPIIPDNSQMNFIFSVRNLDSCRAKHDEKICKSTTGIDGDKVETVRVNAGEAKAPVDTFDKYLSCIKDINNHNNGLTTQTNPAGGLVSTFGNAVSNINGKDGKPSQGAGFAGALISGLGQFIGSQGSKKGSISTKECNRYK